MPRYLEKDDPRAIDWLDLEDMIAHCLDGHVVHILHLYDANGVECEADDACYILAGDSEGVWFADITDEAELH